MVLILYHYQFDPFVPIKSLFDKLFKQGPEPNIFIHLRVSRTAYELCVSCRKTELLLCQIFHSRASFRPALPLAYDYGWTQRGLPTGQNCVAINNTRTNSSRLTMSRSCISLYAGNLPLGPAEEGEENPRLQRYLCATSDLCLKRKTPILVYFEIT